MKTKASKNELSYLFEKVIEKYNQGHVKKIRDNTNPNNYTPLVEELNVISSKFKETAMEFKHADYATIEKGKLAFNAKQFMSATKSFTEKPNQAIVDACYIYLYKVGQLGFRESPTDTKLESIILSESGDNQGSLLSSKKKTKALLYIMSLVIILLIIVSVKLRYDLKSARSSELLATQQLSNTKKQWDTLKKDLSILRYRPTQAEIDSLVGVWFCYTGSPQARTTLTDRYRVGARNVVVITQKNGYFNFKRYSTNFDQTGYIQYESPGLVSIHSHKVNDRDSTLWPRHSLMFVNNGRPFHIAISASWNFDTPPNDFMIGIREVYVKLGTGGKVNEIFNQGNPVKTIEWITNNKKREVFNIKLMKIENMNIEFGDLINEKSILLALPKENVLPTKKIN